VLLLGGLGLLLAFSAAQIWGWSSLPWVAVCLAAIALFAPRIPPEAILRMYQAREIDPRQGGSVTAVIGELARRADLGRTPRLFVIPSMTLNAFATGSRDGALVAVTEGLLRKLSLRELAGVLAHEISHIRNKDLWIMGLADVISRFTQALSYTGMMLAAFNILGMLAGTQLISWGAILVLYLAPLISSLLQLGLSRAREYDADLEAVVLTGDPGGLISALQKLERYTGRFWQDLMLPVPGRQVPQPSLLRTHPTTEERIARLRELAPNAAPAAWAGDPVSTPLFAAGGPIRSPRYRWPGVWY
jgi:heat shock protein HtpX